MAIETKKITGTETICRHFFGGYSTHIWILFDTEEYAALAMSVLGDKWKLADIKDEKNKARVISWAGNRSELGALKESLPFIVQSRGFARCSHQYKNPPINNCNHSMDRDTVFTLTLEMEDPNQVPLFPRTPMPMDPNTPPISDKDLKFLENYGHTFEGNALRQKLPSIISRLRKAEKKVTKVVGDGKKKYDDVLFDLRGIIWPEDGPEKEFGADTYEEIVAMLDEHGITPPEEYKSTLTPMCDQCGKIASYNEKYDSTFCAKCNKWLESACEGGPGCAFNCAKRPEKPITEGT